MSLLWWDKPAPATPPADHQRTYSADGAVPGAYVPNMSAEDRHRWKARRVGGVDPRIEIRRGMPNGSLLVMVVRPHGVTLSMNNKVQFDDTGWEDFCKVRDEAVALLKDGT